MWACGRSSGSACKLLAGPRGRPGTGAAQPPPWCGGAGGGRLPPQAAARTLQEGAKDVGHVDPAQQLGAHLPAARHLLDVWGDNLRDGRRGGGAPSGGRIDCSARPCWRRWERAALCGTACLCEARRCTASCREFGKEASRRGWQPEASLSWLAQRPAPRRGRAPAGACTAPVVPGWGAEQVWYLGFPGFWRCIGAEAWCGQSQARQRGRCRARRCKAGEGERGAAKATL